MSHKADEHEFLRLWVLPLLQKDPTRELAYIRTREGALGMVIESTDAPSLLEDLDDDDDYYIRYVNFIELTIPVECILCSKPKQAGWIIADNFNDTKQLLCMSCGVYQ